MKNTRDVYKRQSPFLSVKFSGLNISPVSRSHTSSSPVSYTHLDVYKRQDERLLVLLERFVKLLPEFTALENVAIPALIHGESQMCIRDSHKAFGFKMGIIAQRFVHPLIKADVDFRSCLGSVEI